MRSIHQRHSRNDLGQPWFAIAVWIGFPFACSFCTASERGDPSNAASNTSQSHFFESKIRPVLIRHCYECHSSDAEDLGGGLYLDSANGMVVGGDSGPSIIAGDADESLLIAALRYESMEMPPDGKLSDAVIADFEKWIDNGATDPRTSNQSLPRRQRIDLEEGRKFWAFQPLSSEVPITENADADLALASGIELPAAGPIDRFLDAQRSAMQSRVPEGRTWNVNSAASPQQRLRRVSFDLTGLPPSIDLQNRWLANPSQRSWIRLIDEMLASVGYAEHWARHWMDVARYADSNGSDFNATFHEAFRYRDYLVTAFATDKPFDQFVREQIAGDLMTADSDDERYDQIAASTFLMLGTKMLSERDKAKLKMDVVDEQLDTIGRAFMGLTLGCARCHDHKFDPIPTEDYYAMAGILSSTVTLKGESQKYVSTWNRQPLPTSSQHRKQVARSKSQISKLESEIDKLEKRIKKVQTSQINAINGVVVDDSEAEKVGTWKPSVFSKSYIGAGYIHDDNRNKGKSSLRFSADLPVSGRYEVRFAYYPSGNRAKQIQVHVETRDGHEVVTLDQTRVDLPPIWGSLGEFEFLEGKPAAVSFSNQGTKGYVIADAIQFLPTFESDDDPVDSGTAESKAADSKAANSEAVNFRAKEVEARDDLKSLTKTLENQKSKLKKLKKNAPTPLPEAMAPADESGDKIGDIAVHIRGESARFGPIVPRGFLQVCGNGDATIAQPKGSGRLELADWLTDPDHPLVARVIVNRVWMYLMGEGIVQTVDQFGMQGDRPSHPELLDYLAGRLIKNGWHLKPIIREILVSDAYSRSTAFHSDWDKVDPANRLLWRANRKRIPAESIRDTMLTCADGLVRQHPRDLMRGHGVLVASNNANDKASIDDLAKPYRTIYLPMVRGYIPALLSSMDLADPDLLTGRRTSTNVPGQAFVLVNSPEVNQWATATAERIVDHSDDPIEQLQFATKICLQREPHDFDVGLMQQVVGSQPDMISREENVLRWQQLVAAWFASTEFRLLD